MQSVSASTDFEKNDKNDNGVEPVKMSKDEYNRQYRTPVLTAPLTQLSPDAGPTIIQHKAVTVYNPVNKKVRDVIDFLHEALLAYTKGGLNLLKKRYHELPLILVGDFNIQFDIDEGLRCVQFIGDLVLFTDERFPSSKWLLAPVVTLHPELHGLTRIETLVTIKTSTTTLTNLSPSLLCCHEWTNLNQPQISRYKSSTILLMVGGIVTS
ncbi:hypothetical protein PV325_001599 [Microctonus aethiopoides]|nr:hypothetical protein PV325_001599 [Microctonus aethiopoides]